MHYYKIINGSNFVGVGTTLDLRRFQFKHRIVLCCEEDEAQYIQCEGILYHADWMKPETMVDSGCLTLDVIKIDKTEYDTLYKAVESGEEVQIPDEEISEEPYIDQTEEITIEYVRNSKISEINNICNKTIISGFDIVLSDNESHHFSLTTQDQLNLITLSTMVASGEQEIPYHADGEPCKYYSVNDINSIISMATFFKTYQVSYFNALKIYIESLEDIESVSQVYYGIEIPTEYQTEVLQSLLKQMAENSVYA